MSTRPVDVEIAVVGGGPAGAAVAALLAGAGREVVLLERQPAWRWRACGVFSSPATVAALRRVGLDEAALTAVARPIPAMRVEVPGAEPFRLAYGDDGLLRHSPVGFDRAALDPALLALARRRGAAIEEGVTVSNIRLGTPNILTTRGSDGEPGRVRARVVVGADGSRSVVARAAGVVGRPPLAERVGLTYHVEDATTTPHDARMVVLEDGYVGIAPVPGERLNIGIVLGRRGQAMLRERGAAATTAAVEARVGLSGVRHCDAVAGAAPLANAATRRAGDTWVLVGDAAGFLDPFTGEGLHRSIVSAELAASAIVRGDLAAYARAMTARFRSKDVVSLVVQAFLARPALFAYAARRLASRERVRETMGLVMGDLVPASAAVDPRYLAALLRP